MTGDNHCYPLHLGGHPKQPMYHLNAANHTRFHDYFRERGLGPGSRDAGPNSWKSMSLNAQKQFLIDAMRHANVPEPWIQKNISSIMKGTKPGFNFSPYRKASRARLAKLAKLGLIAGVAFEILANPSTVYAAKVKMDWRDSVMRRRYGDCTKPTEIAMFKRVVMVPTALNLFSELESFDRTVVVSWEDQRPHDG